MYKEVIDPLLNLLDSERTHVYARELLHVAERLPGGFGLLLVHYLGHEAPRISDERLMVEIGGHGPEGFVFDNPLIVGAGWDKVGHAVLGLGYLGFAGVTVGTVLPHAQYGNKKPRQCMLTPGVAYNELGFNTPGVEVVQHNLSRYRLATGHATPLWLQNQPSARWPLRIGASVGRNRDTENRDAPAAHADVMSALYHQADWFEHAVSSPNTPGLRRLQEPELLADIIQAGNAVMDSYGRRKPVFVKASPDLSLDAAMDMARVVIDNGAAGIIFGNTTSNPRIKGVYGEQYANRPGGLSGDNPQFRALSTNLIRHVYRETRGAIMLWGAGGIRDVSSAVEKIMAGASALQIVTAIRGEGPRVASRINAQLLLAMNSYGVGKMRDMVGSAAR